MSFSGQLVLHWSPPDTQLSPVAPRSCSMGQWPHACKPLWLAAIQGEGSQSGLKPSGEPDRGVWNVHTLLDRDASSRPERRDRTHLEGLGRYQIDFAAISETRLTEEGSIAEPKRGYTFFWKGKAKDENKIHGVGLAIGL